jgi:hypothetical protein
MNADPVVLRSGYWRVEVDTARPHVVSLRADAEGRGQFGQDMLEPGWGGDSAIELADGVHSSRDGTGQAAALAADGQLEVRGIRLGDLAVLDWTLGLCGPGRSVLRIGVRREMLRETQAVTDLVFGLHCLREFAFWSRPSLRFGSCSPSARIPTTIAFSPRASTWIPFPRGDITHGCGRFGLWLNGGILLGPASPASHELYARAEGGGAEVAWEMLRDVIAQWEQDHLCGTPLFDWCRPGWQDRVAPRHVYTGKNAFTWIDGRGATGAGMAEGTGGLTAGAPCGTS